MDILPLRSARSPPQRQPPEREEAQHAAEDDERFADVVARGVDADFEIGSGGEQGSPGDERRSQQRERSPFFSGGVSHIVWVD